MVEPLRSKRPHRVVPEVCRRVPLRTFADWNEPLPGGMEMDTVAHCGEVNRSNYIHSLPPSVADCTMFDREIKKPKRPRTASVTSLERQPVTKLREAIRTVFGIPQRRRRIPSS
jgi:hypothetical protein